MARPNKASDACTKRSGIAILKAVTHQLHYFLNILDLRRECFPLVPSLQPSPHFQCSQVEQVQSQTEKEEYIGRTM